MWCFTKLYGYQHYCYLAIPKSTVCVELNVQAQDWGCGLRSLRQETPSSVMGWALLVKWLRSWETACWWALNYRRPLKFYLWGFVCWWYNCNRSDCFPDLLPTIPVVSLLLVSHSQLSQWQCSLCFNSGLVYCGEICFGVRSSKLRVIILVLQWVWNKICIVKWDAGYPSLTRNIHLCNIKKKIENKKFKTFCRSLYLECWSQFWAPCMRKRWSYLQELSEGLCIVTTKIWPKNNAIVCFMLQPNWMWVSGHVAERTRRGRYTRFKLMVNMICALYSW